MIPLKLRIAGFLSYREPVELDFTGFDLACISGHNGAGKSSLLDAITWAVFGQARKRDDSLVNLQSKAAEVALTFSYESNVYRIQRTLPRGKTTILEFQVADGESWRPLTEKTRSETAARIRQTLRLDYETFVNASFFLQGKADEFTQKKASERKAVLGLILGLEMWETYRERTAERRKSIEREVSEIEGRIAEIDAELAEEEPRKARLAELDAQLKTLTSLRTTQEAALENIKRTSASLAEQRRLADTLSAALTRSQNSLSGLQARLAAKEADASTFADLVKRAEQVEAAYQAWQSARAEVTRLDGIAAQFHEHDEKRQPLLREIESEKARLEQELMSLTEQSEAVQTQSATAEELKGKIAAAQSALEEITSKLTTRNGIESQLQAGRERQAELKAENEALKVQMDEMKMRIDRLEETEGAECPLCGQPLTADHRLQTIEQLRQDGKGSGDRYRANLAEAKSLGEALAEYTSQMAALSNAEREQLAASNSVSQLTERREALERQYQEWEHTGAKRLKEVNKILESGKYAVEAHKTLKQLDKELARLGYDPSAHEAARQAEAAQREAEDQHLNLEKAKAALQPIEDEIANLRSEIGNRESEIGTQRADYERVASALAAAEAQLSYTEVRSPFAGTITEQLVFPGDMAKPDSPMFTVADLHVAIARAQVPEEQASSIRNGQACTFTGADAADRGSGKVSMINRAVDPARRTVEVWCEIPNGEARLRAGVFGTVEFVTGKLEHAIMVPVAAVQFEEGTRKGFVMVVGTDRKAHKRDVETGAEESGRVPVLQRLKAGETVIVEGGYGLPDGTDVKLAEAPQK